MDESGRGYICLDCQNTEAFDATSDLYRLYKREDEDEQNSFDGLYSLLKDKGFKSWKWDENFDPFRLALVQIVSNGILVQNENGFVEEDSRYKNGRYIAI